MSRSRRPSPALAVAALALAVALGGTGYAAVALPAGSVGTKQLRDGAVVAAKVKPRSLLASNFKAGQLPQGARGATGLPGPAGPAGPTGAAGPKGDPATKLFATVRQKASGGGVELGPSSGVTTLVPQGGGSGMYDLTFAQDVGACAVVAMGGGKNSSGGMVSGQATAVTTGGGGVSVQTLDPGGSTVDLDFFTVAVFC